VTLAGAGLHRPAPRRDLEGTVTWRLLTDLAQGALITIWLSALGIAIGVPLGLGLALVRVWRLPVLAPLVAGYVSVVRATPLVTLALLIFFGFPQIGIELPLYVAAVVTLGLNTAAFHAEIWRASILDFPGDQLEAARAAGMTRWLAFRRIVLPQAWRASLPGMVNEMTFLLKTSPAIAVIGVVDLTRSAARVAAYTYDPLPPFITATIIYMLVVAVMVRSQRLIETAIVRRYGVL
jgi:His/Glu/Gln/Arg/opine family amino acid ABC transporter permease subunit